MTEESPLVKSKTGKKSKKIHEKDQIEIKRRPRFDAISGNGSGAPVKRIA